MTQTNGVDQLPAFPMPRGCPLHPPEPYSQLREHAPVSRVMLDVTGRPTWVIARHEHVKEVLASPAMSSSWKDPGYPLQVALPAEFLENYELPLIAMDPPDHTVRRRLIIPELTARRMQDLRPRIQQLVDERIDAMLAAGPPADLVTALAAPVPGQVFAELVGASAEDAAFFRRHAEATMTRGVSGETLASMQAEMEARLDAMVTAKEKTPTDDVLGRIVRRNQQDGALAHESVVAVARILMFGGFDTVANMISLGVVTLLRHPDQLAELTAQETLLPQAIGELLRFLSINDSASRRVAVADVEIGGQLIRKGEGVILLYGSANRDERVFTDPDAFDIHRDTRHHVALGGGIHQCPGGSLTKVELEVVFGTLFRRIPGLRLAVPFEELPFRNETLMYGLHELPVEW
ncbi:cytochrome P450 [Actinoplanes sp. NPDC051343]|uniref:cytochrome P450 n=1 Tax=Actinoplanes sp. NPDC051343 TaxID=3363906 RepID=UPI0037A79396